MLEAGRGPGQPVTGGPAAPQRPDVLRGDLDQRRVHSGGQRAGVSALPCEALASLGRCRAMECPRSSALATTAVS
jgi:hypothetical protein